MPRLVDEKLLESFRMMEICEACRAPRQTLVRLQPHHTVVTVGAGGPDIPHNLMALCWPCHAKMDGQIPKWMQICTIACRMGTTPEDIKETVWRVMREHSKVVPR